MCQLMFVHSGNALLNRIYLTALMFADEQGNTDGTGMLTVSNEGYDVYKSKHSPSSLPDLGVDVYERVISPYPVLAHVRAASKGMEITDENAHPFIGKRFVLAHNGRLYRDNESVHWDGGTSDTSGTDSEKFLGVLEEIAAVNHNRPFPEMIRDAMSKHKGKFALMIYDTYTDIYYIARGSTADLHISNLHKITASGKTSAPFGFVVNTKKTDLNNALQFANQVAQSATGYRLGYSTPVELKKDTLYMVNGSLLEEVCELKENPVTYAYSGTPQNNNYTQGITVNMTIKTWSLSNRILDFMNEHFLSIHDIDAMMELFLGVRMADCTEETLELFCNNVIPKTSSDKKIRQRLKKVLGDHGKVYFLAYQKIPKLAYPWMLSDKSALEDLVKYEESFVGRKK